MSSNLPLRTIRIPALRNQCLHQQRRHAKSPRAFSTTSPHAFASSSPRLRGGSSLGQDRAITRAATRTMIGPAPKVNEIKAQEEGALSDDIGLLQDTLVRAPWSKLPGAWTPGFWGYMWKLIKSKGTALYSRSLYKRCIYKTGWWRFAAIDAGNKKYIKDRAMNLYIQLYVNFARGDMSPVSRFCLPPVLRSFQDRVAARGPLTMEWQLTKTPSMSIVSHRASLFGDDQPDTAYRQAVIRIVSTQKLTVKPSAVAVGRRSSVSESVNRTRRRKSIEESHEVHTDASFPENTQPRKVVEYFVLQRRVIRGQEEDWKIWGFTQASTPAKIEDDEAYWRKTLDSQAAGA